jgi:vacuolar protein sorting-associated protein 41
MESGQLVHQRTKWYTQKYDVLFDGQGSPICSITRRGDLVAWADALHVRVMNIVTKSALCYVSCPIGVTIHNSFPCHIFWESNQDLYIGWADSFRHLEIGPAMSSGSSSFSGVDRGVVARTKADWQTDCIICGVSSFDEDHVAILGYVPPDEDEFTAASESKADAYSNTNRPELQIIKRLSGDVVSCDTLPLIGEVMTGPWAFSMLSTFQIPSKSKDAHKWRISDLSAESMAAQDANAGRGNGNARGLPPTLFIIVPQDFVAARVRDVNDRIATALQSSNVTLAVNLALSDRASLKHYHFHDLITLYLDDLLDSGDAELAAKECSRLIGSDIALWERWIYAFAKRKYLGSIFKLIPLTRPRLPLPVYEVVIETFLQQSSKDLLAVVELWGKVHPPLFSREGLLGRLEAARELDAYCHEVKAQLYVFGGQYERALNCYLDIKYPGPLSSSSSESLLSQGELKHTHVRVFELIEKEELFDVVRDKVVNLIRLSSELAGNLLVNNVDKLPIASVVAQLRTDRRVLHWYLHTMFTRHEPYNNDPVYLEYHVMQISLYAEFAPKFAPQTANPPSPSGRGSSSSSSDPGGWNDNLPELVLPSRSKAPESEFLHFLRTTKLFTDIDLPSRALKECEKRRPPLYNEMIYLLDVQGSRREALVSSRMPQCVQLSYLRLIPALRTTTASQTLA